MNIGDKIEFKNDIRMIRDIGIVLDFKMLSNVDRDFHWVVKNDHIFIECKHRTSKTYKSIILEFCGNGLIAANAIDRLNNSVDTDTKIFNINRYGEGALPAFRQFLLNEYQYYLA